MSNMIVSNKIKTSLDDRRKEISADPEKWRAKQRARKAPAVSSNKTQPAEFKSGKIKGVDLSKMITTTDVEPKRAGIKAKSVKKRKSPGKGGKKSSNKSSSNKKNVAPVSSESVKQENKA